MSSMASFRPSFTFLLSCGIAIVLLSSPAFAFGAGNIASLARIEGQNWRHGDIEDTLLNILMSRAAGGKKFGKLDVKRVYFGNWLRDYSQAVDVGTVKYVSAQAIVLLLKVLGFMSFGYGSREFEVTYDRLGCYRPEEHIDNPKDYADNEDARQYDRRLRAPVDERRELAINPQTGLKNYIATENMGIATSAGLVRSLFGRSIQLGRKYARSKNKADLYEALRLLGTGCHCLEDYSAHSNYTELALIELGERQVFPHVGRRTQINLPETRQSVFPLITGTFGGVDFLHSVMGEVSDKATQSEIQQLEGTIQQSGQSDTSILQDLLNQVPSGLFGDQDQAGKANELQANAQAAQMQHTHISPREPEAFTREIEEICEQINPILEWHDEMMQSITEAIEKIPVLPALIEQLTDQLNMFVFSLMAPFVLPVINQVKTELNTGSSEIIQSSMEKQHIVFHDDYSSDPTHSMLSKDHFSNILNEPAGKVASQVLKWVVPQLIQCFDDERADVDRTLTRIINGVFHHPHLRDFGQDGAVDGRRLMFGVVQEWWESKDERERDIFRDQLSREGVEEGRNHKQGVHDTGHGCGKPLGIPTAKTASSSGAIGGTIIGDITSALAGESQYDSGYKGSSGRKAGGGSSDIGKLAGEAVGGGAVGGIVGGLVGGLGGDLLGEAFGGSETKKKTYQSERTDDDGSYTHSFQETGYRPERGGRSAYGQAEYSQTSFSGGGEREEYQRYQQEDTGRSGYGQQVIRESRPTYGGGYEQTTETRYQTEDRWQSEVRREGRDEEGRGYSQVNEYEGRGSYKQRSEDEDSDGSKKKKKKKHGSGHDYAEGDEYSVPGSFKNDSEDEDSDGSKKKKKKKHQKRDSDDDDDDNKGYRRQSGGYGESTQQYGSGGYGGEERQSGYGAGGYGGENRYQEQRSSGYGGEERSGYGSSERYGSERPAYGGGEGYSERQEGYGGQQEEYGSRQGYGGGERQGYGGGEGYGEEREERSYEQGDGGYGQGGGYGERRGYGEEGYGGGY